MPHCYFVNDYRQSEVAVIDSNPPERAEHGLPPLLIPALAGDDDDDDDNDGLAGAGRWTKPRARDRVEATPAVPGQGQLGGGTTAGGDGTLTGAGAGAGAGTGTDGRGPVVLCNFNRLHKIDPHTFGAWMEVSRNSWKVIKDAACSGSLGFLLLCSQTVGCSSSTFLTPNSLLSVRAQPAHPHGLA